MLFSDVDELSRHPVQATRRPALERGRDVDGRL
jgi:hypothetical protein